MATDTTIVKPTGPLFDEARLAIAGVHVGTERPTACERLLHLLPSRVLVEGVDGQLGLDLDDEWPLLLWHASGIQRR